MSAHDRRRRPPSLAQELLLKLRYDVHRSLNRNAETPAQQMSRVAREALMPFVHGSLATFVEALAADAELMKQSCTLASRHELGFIKWPLLLEPDFRLRLHLYPQGARGNEAIHSHRWHRASAVIAGILWTRTYSDAARVDSALPVAEFHYHRPDGPAGRTQVQYVGTTHLCPLNELGTRAGEFYAAVPDPLHQVLEATAMRFAATLVVTAAPCRIWNRLCLARGDRMPDFSVRTVGASELLRNLEMLKRCLLKPSKVA